VRPPFNTGVLGNARSKGKGGEEEKHESVVSGPTSVPADSQRKRPVRSTPKKGGGGEKENLPKEVLVIRKRTWDVVSLRRHFP